MTPHRLSLDRLSGATADRLPPGVDRPGYDPTTQATGIVHLGLGAFHRAHQAVYTDAAMEMGDTDWRIAGVSLRSATVRDELAPQDGLYTVTERLGDGRRTRLVGAIGRVLVAPEAPGAVVAALAAPATRIVSLTVTEAGYLRGADGALNRDNPALAADLAGGPPQTVYGFLAAALAKRRASRLPGLTLMSCDNLSENGPRLAALVAEFLDDANPALARWFEMECACPSTMVDRIVPAPTDAERDEVARALGVRDDAAVFTEPFRQWVIEDRFAGPRPRWEAVGATLVADVSAFEAAKLRMLNGAHSALAYIGLSLGHAFVHEAVGDPRIRPLVRSLILGEAAPGLRPAPGQDLEGYAADLFDRFDNPALQHRLAQIAMDGSQKIPQRWLTTLKARQRVGADCPALRVALAAWLTHLRDADPLVDPDAEALRGLWAGQDADSVVAALFGPAGRFSDDWIATADDAGAIRDLIALPADARVRGAWSI